MELVILVGLQGAGKTTFCRERFAATHAHVSKDNFRSNPRPARRQRHLIAEAFAAGRSVVVDNTNPTVADRAELVELGRAAGAAVACFFFPPDVESSLWRNALREGKARVPDHAVRITAARLEPPTPAEGFDRLYHVRLVEGGGFEVTQVGGAMRPDDFEGRMRRLECFHALKCPDGAWVVLRLDGRGFTRFTDEHFEKPFDERFHRHMVAAARAVLEDFGGVYAYTESDEVSVLLPRGWAHFDREVEKAVSVSAGIASAVFTLACGTAAHFDARVVVAATDEQVTDYFRWRQADATRCALNGWCYWTLRKEGLDPRAATKQLSGLTVADKNELLFRRGTNFNDLPAWQKRGTGLTWEAYPHAGRNPLSGEQVMATRRRVREDRELPTGDAYAAMIAGLLAGATTAGRSDAEGA